MKEYRLSPEALVMVQGSSKGTQPKYYENGYWYKVNNVGYENIAEYLISVLLKHSNVKSYVDYEPCMINGRPGCRSKNFLKPNESFLSFQRLYELYTGESLQEKMLTISDAAGRIDFVKGFVENCTGFDCSTYLSQILTLDALTLNTDRHFNNLGIIVNSQTGEYRNAPVFDNGNALLSDWEKFSEETIEENLDRVYGQPFSSSLGMQAKTAGFGLALDYDALYKELETEPDSRGLQVLKYQLEHMRNIIPDISDLSVN